MNKDILKGKWHQVKGEIKNWWADMTDDDIKHIEGDSEKFIGKLQEKFGWGRERAEQELNEFLNQPDGQRRRAS